MDNIRPGPIGIVRCGSEKIVWGTCDTVVLESR